MRPPLYIIRTLYLGGRIRGSPLYILFWSLTCIIIVVITMSDHMTIALALTDPITTLINLFPIRPYPYPYPYSLLAYY